MVGADRRAYLASLRQYQNVHTCSRRPEAGHVPQIEQPERLLKLVWEFADSITAPPVAGSFEER